MNLVLSDAAIICEEKEKFIFCTEIKKITLKKNNITNRLVKDLIELKKVNLDRIGNQKSKLFYEMLYKNRILIEDYEDIIPDIEKANFNYLLYEKKEAKNLIDNLKKYKILIVGMGGIGQSIIQHLAAAGFRQFIIVDYDTVKIENFNRLFLLDEKHIGIMKIQVVSENLRKVYSDISINEYRVNITNKKMLNDILNMNEKVEMIICAADYPTNEYIRSLIVQVSLEYKIPCAIAGVGHYFGEVGPILFTQNAKVHYLQYLNQCEVNKIYNPILKGSICFTNSVVSVLLAYEVFNYFVQRKVSIRDKTLVYDFRDGIQCKNQINWDYEVKEK